MLLCFGDGDATVFKVNIVYLQCADFAGYQVQSHIEHMSNHIGRTRIEHKNEPHKSAST